MNTVTNISLISVFSLVLCTNANASSVQDTISELAARQLSEISQNIKQQAQHSMQQTVNQLTERFKLQSSAASAELQQEQATVTVIVSEPKKTEEE
ncbi:hypothetical protein [Arsukibacterium sp.]|uniref:hypothetical protein n=1 Tax=Arsukibacterium sp. TaxID=1977258 RepID=UPI002FDA5C0D